MVDRQPGRNLILAGAIVLALLVAAVIAIPAVIGAFDKGPEDYLRANYTWVSGEDADDESGMVFHSEEDPETTATDIASDTGADETQQETGTYYLRYDSDWLVVVEPDDTGSQITFFDFEHGYRAHSPSLLFWGTYYERSRGGFFRGGGSGFGK